MSQTDHYGQGNNHGPDRRTAVGVNGHARAAHVPRMLSVLFLRNARDDTHRDGIKYEGYVPCWPNRKRLGVAMDQFCTQGCRLLGLGRRMKGKTEQLVELGFHPVEGLEAALTRPGDGIRCRRFFLERRGQTGQMYFFNGSPTDAVFDLDRDEEPVLEWLGLRDMEDGDRCWFDLSARSL